MPCINLLGRADLARGWPSRGLIAAGSAATPGVGLEARPLGGGQRRVQAVLSLSSHHTVMVAVVAYDPSEAAQRVVEAGKAWRSWG